MKDWIYDTPDYNKLQDKDNFAENLTHRIGASSETLFPLIWFYGSDTANVDPCGGGVRAALVSTSIICQSPVQCTPFQKNKVENSEIQSDRKGQVRQQRREEKEREESKKEYPSEAP